MGLLDEVEAQLLDLHRQATIERSHYYTGKCIENALAAIATLRAENAALRARIAELEAPPRFFSGGPRGGTELDAQ